MVARRHNSCAVHTVIPNAGPDRASWPPQGCNTRCWKRDRAWITPRSTRRATATMRGSCWMGRSSTHHMTAASPRPLRPTRSLVAEVLANSSTAPLFLRPKSFLHHCLANANLVGQVIKGWTEAMQLMVQGDKWELYIPMEMAYGPSGRPPKVCAIAHRSICHYRLRHSFNLLWGFLHYSRWRLLDSQADFCYAHAISSPDPACGNTDLHDGDRQDTRLYGA